MLGATPFEKAQTLKVSFIVYNKWIKVEKSARQLVDYSYIKCYYMAATAFTVSPTICVLMCIHIV